MQFQGISRQTVGLEQIMNRAPRPNVAERAVRLADPLMHPNHAGFEEPLTPGDVLAWTAWSVRLLRDLFPGCGNVDLVVLPDDQGLPSVRTALAGRQQPFFRMLLERFCSRYRSGIRPELIEQLRVLVRNSLLADGLDCDGVASPVAMARMSRHSLAFCLLHAGLLGDDATVSQLEPLAKMTKYAAPICRSGLPDPLWIAQRA